MSEENNRKTVQGFIDAIVDRNVERALSFFADDAVYVAPEGTFAGKDEVRRYLTWSIQSVRSFTVTATGTGLTVCGDKAFYEHILGGTYEGVRGEWLALCVYEFRDDRIQSVRAVYDRLSLLRQIALRWPSSSFVGFIVKRMERGLT
jgi:hypothetical protein